jgi:lysophospholipase L1-like esterase
MYNVLRGLQRNLGFALSLTFLVILPEQGFASTNHSTLLVGDSVMSALSSRYTNAAQNLIGGDLKFQAKVCRKLTTSGCLHGQPESALNVLKGNHGIDTVVILIGHNDDRGVHFRQKVSALMNEVSDAHHVFWMTMREVSHSYREANKMIKEEVALHKNAHVIDWAEISRNQPSWVVRDGTHLTATGAKNMASVIAKELQILERNELSSTH